eukprot:462_1
MKLSFVKTALILIGTAIILTILFCISDDIKLQKSNYYYSSQNDHKYKSYNADYHAKSLSTSRHSDWTITNIVNTSSTGHDYNQLFANYISKDSHRLSQSDKKIKWLFTVSIQSPHQNILHSLFNALSDTDPHHIIYLSDTATHSILFHLYECWSYDIWGATHTCDIYPCPEHNHCAMMQAQFNQISSNASTNTVFISSWTFPLQTDSMKYPDMVQLIEWTQNAVPYPMDVHLLILNTDFNDSLSLCLQSSKNKMYAFPPAADDANDCSHRIHLLSHMLNAMHSQIMQIDPMLWTLINYTDFATNTIAYIPIFQALLSGYVSADKILSVIHNLSTLNPSHAVPNPSNIGQFNALQLWSINESYYSPHVANRWPLLQDQMYTLNPRQQKQIHINYNDIYSHYIAKDHRALDTSAKKLTMVWIVGVEGVGHHFVRGIFDELVRIDQTHYVHQGDQPWPIHPLWLLMDQCFAFDMWGLVKTPGWLVVNRQDLPHIERNMSVCDIAQKRINEYSKSMANNSVLFMSTHYSFPYDDPVPNRYPDFVKLIEWAQNAQPFPFDVRVLVLKRDYKTSIISTCVKRFGGCPSRVALLANMLNVIHAQLLQIDAEFWMQINYTDLVSTNERMMQYAPILSSFLNVKLENIERAIRHTCEEYNKRKKKQKQSRPVHKKDEFVINEKQEWAIQASYYSQHVQNRWPLFSNGLYTVTPVHVNDSDLNEKTFVVPSNASDLP